MRAIVVFVVVLASAVVGFTGKELLQRNPLLPSRALVSSAESLLSGILPDIVECVAIVATLVALGFIATHGVQVTQSKKRRRQMIDERRALVREQIYLDIDNETGRLTEEARDLAKLKAEFLTLFAKKTSRYLFDSLGEAMGNAFYTVEENAISMEILVRQGARDIALDAISRIVNRGTIPQRPAVPHGDVFGISEEVVIEEYGGSMVIRARLVYHGAPRYAVPIEEAHEACMLVEPVVV